MDLQEVEFGGNGVDRAGSGQGQASDTYECVNEPSGSIKNGEFRDYLRAGWLLNKDCTALSVYLCVPICIISQQNIHKYNNYKSNNNSNTYIHFSVCATVDLSRNACYEHNDDTFK